MRLGSVSCAPSAFDTLAEPFGPNRHGRGHPNGAFCSGSSSKAGHPLIRPTFETAVSTWRAGDTIQLGRSMLTVIAVRDRDADQPPVLVVEMGE